MARSQTETTDRKQEGQYNTCRRKHRNNGDDTRRSNFRETDPTVPKEADNTANNTRHCSPSFQRHTPKVQEIGCSMERRVIQTKQHKSSHTTTPNNDIHRDCGGQEGSTSHNEYNDQTTIQQGKPRSLLQKRWTSGTPRGTDNQKDRTTTHTDAQIRKINSGNSLDNIDHQTILEVSKSSINDRSLEMYEGSINGEKTVKDIRLIQDYTNSHKRPFQLTTTTINISGYSPSKAIKIRSILDNHSSTVAIISETRTRLCRQLSGQGRPYMIEGEGRDPAGVAVVFPTKINANVTVKTDRFVQLTLANNIEIIGVYGPNETTNISAKTTFWKELTTMVETSIKHHDIVIVIGDLNAGHEPLTCKKPTGGPNILRLNEFVQKTGLKMIETLPTWKSYAAKSNNKTRTLDRCLIHCNSEFEATPIVDWENRLSDHAILSIKFVFKHLDRNKGRPFNKLQSIEDSVDSKWTLAKETLRNKKIDASEKVDNALNTFWKCRKAYLSEIQENLILTDTEGTPLESTVAIITATNYYKELWETKTNTSGHQLITPSTLPPQTPPPSLNEVTSAIQELKRDTAMGCDGISSNTVTSKLDISSKTYTQILADVWASGHIPKEWKDMRVKLIPKKDAHTTINNTRPITCLSTSCKILNNILAQRSYTLYEMALHPSQHAYRRQRSVWTAKSELISVLDSRDTSVVTFLDISKAFDRISRATVHKALAYWNIPMFEQHLILQQYQNQQVFIEVQGKKAEPFGHLVGIKQGCILSGMLFNLVIAIITYNVHERLSSQVYKVISYSDDILIISEDRMTNLVVTKVLEEQLHECGLTLNKDKNTTIIFDKRIESNMTVEWLGTIFRADRTWEQEIESRISKAKSASNEIKQLCKHNSLKIARSIMTNILESLVVTHLKYPLDVVLYSSKDKEKVINVLTAIILDGIKMSEENALDLAEQFLGYKQKVKQVKRKIFQSKDRPPLPSTSLISPTQDQINERKHHTAQLQEERRWCLLCLKPTYYKDINGHRRRTHNVEALPRLHIDCTGCKRSLDSGAYYRHDCIGSYKPSGMLECHLCGSMYGKHGLARHIPSCKGSKILINNQANDSNTVIDIAKQN